MARPTKPLPPKTVIWRMVMAAAYSSSRLRRKRCCG
jgi:hypothetical protein